MKIVVATSNAHKVREVREILAPHGFEVVGAEAVGGMPSVEEDGMTFRENAVKKAVAAARALHCTVLADDSGLEVAALHGAPGVYSARYAGEGGNDGRNVEKLLRNLQGVTDRSARFVCCIAVADENGKLLGTAEGEARGCIAEECRGQGGFGYDPVFVPEGYCNSFGELPETVKNRLSHRANALHSALKEIFRLA